MSSGSQDKQQLRARARTLKAAIIIGRAGLTDAVIDEIRRRFTRTDLLKIRIGVPDHDQVDPIVERIAVEVPCELVSRLGFVATFVRQTD